MNYLSVEKLTKTYGTRVLFENISFGIDKGQKTALIAANGTGKTTLLNIIAGRDTPDSGEATLRRDIKVGYLAQVDDLNPALSVIDAVFDSPDELIQTVKQYELAVKEGHDLQDLLQKMDELNAWDFESKVHQALDVLNIKNLDQQVATLSGGQRKRVNLAKTLLTAPDFLVLDEPTNHLDLEMIEWLEGYLSKAGVTLLMVTHDRYFLDRVCNDILEIDHGNLHRYKGNYSFFLEKKEEREQRESSEVMKARNLFRKELEWIRRMPKARTTKSKSRIDAFDEIKEQAAGRKAKDDLVLNVKMSRVGGKVLELKKVYKSYDQKPILKGFDYTFKTGERIGIVGRNGTGKSTLLNIITGKEAADSGKVNLGETVVMGYYSQEGIKVKEAQRVIEVVKEIADVIPLADGSKITASQFLHRFGFSNEQQHTYVSKLSGGEKRRLYLLTVLVKNPNFLILDEPTNDLDLLTLNVLEEFLSGFGGCLIIVSHDRYFLDKLVDHLFVFEGDGAIKDFPGNYTDYRNWLQERQEREKQEAKEPATAVVPAIPEKERGQAKKLSYNDRKEFEKLEKEIPLLEKAKAKIEAELNSGELSFDEMQQKALDLGNVITELEEKTSRWFELSEFM